MTVGEVIDLLCKQASYNDMYLMTRRLFYFGRKRGIKNEKEQ